MAAVAAVAAPLAAAGILLPFRAAWSNTNVALLLVVVVVAVAAIGSRVAGAVAAVSAAAWFDFFFTLPYYRFTIRAHRISRPRCCYWWSAWRCRSSPPGPGS